MVGRIAVVLAVFAAAGSLVVRAQGLIFADGFETGDTTQWSATFPPISEPPLGDVTGIIRVDHFGWRPGDVKRAVALGLESETVEVRLVGSNLVVGSFTADAETVDEDSGDAVAPVDFSSVTSPGTYYLYHPAGDQRSYSFRIADDVFGIVGEAAVKSFYFQRCNHSRQLPWAGDALAGYPGVSGRWTDTACHLGDSAATSGPGSPDHGALDLHGGWHDAGDYQKTLWNRGVGHMLWAYELNPTAWIDGQLNLPESGNGIPDLLDEVAWELDFYLRMQRPDGHFMSSVKGNDPTSISPPSSADETRVYFDSTSPSGGGWSGGGVSLVTATANAVRVLAHGAIVFASIGQTTTAATYRTAALAGWSWLDGTGDTGDPHLLCAAAAAVYRLDPTQSSAQTVVESFPWPTWDGLLPFSVTPADSVLTQAAWHYLTNNDGDPAKKNEIRTAVSQAIVDRALAEAGAYGGMYGNPGNGWDWGWGSNRNQALYGSNCTSSSWEITEPMCAYQGPVVLLLSLVMPP